MDLTIILETVIFIILLLFITVSDIKRRIIPNTAVILVTVNTLIFRIIRIAVSKQKTDELKYFVFSFIFSALILFILVSFVSLADRLAGYETMGGGDIKLLSAIVFFFGITKGIMAIFLSCISGLVIYTSCQLARHLSKVFKSSSFDENRSKCNNFPFAPAIFSACLVTIFLGDVAVSWYMSLFV